MSGDKDLFVSARVAAVAANWFARLQEEEAGDQDFREWREWLSQSPEHDQAYQEIEEAWRLIGDVQPVPWVSDAEISESGGSPAVSVSRLLVRSLHTGSLRFVIGALAATVLIVLAYSFVPRFIDRFMPATYLTRTAEQRSILLPDGSRVTLGARTEIRTSFNALKRTVSLDQGEAFFIVAHDVQRPFIVHVGSSDIQALGTSFDVRASKDRIVVSVTEGHVALFGPRPADSQAILAAGEAVAIAPGNFQRQPSRIIAAPTWLQGRFEYRGEELRNVIDDLNRYTDRAIVFDDDSVGTLRYSGTVFPDQVDEWLDGISGVLPITVRAVGDERRIARAR